jgi:hypothetical protein
MYAITYKLFTGTGLHRAPSATKAVEMIGLLAKSGAAIDSIVITRTGKQVSLAELRLLAKDER